MRLYLARHSRTNYNDLGLCNADPTVDVHLTPVGITQAEALADRLKQTDIDHILISELKRTMQTAEIVNKFHHLKLEVDARLNDGRSGFEGRPFEEFDNALNTAKNRWTAKFNDGESIEEIKKRVADFIDDLRTKNYDSVLIVSSEWIIQAMLAIVQNITNEEAWQVKVEQGSYIELTI